MKKPPTQDDLINQYLKKRLELPGYFARTGFQAWLHLALHHPETFPVSMERFLDICISPVLFPQNHSSLDAMLYSYYRVHEERMFPESQLSNWGETPPERTYEQLREDRWKSLISSMSILLTRHILNLPGSTIAGVRSRELPQS